MVFCLPRGLVNSHLETLDKVGLKPYKLTLNSLAVLNCLLLEREEDRPVALVSSSEKEVEMSVATPARLLTSRIFSVQERTADGRPPSAVVLLEREMMREHPNLYLAGADIWQWTPNGGAAELDGLEKAKDLQAWVREHLRPAASYAEVQRGTGAEEHGSRGGEEITPAPPHLSTSAQAVPVLPFSLAAIGAAVDAVDEGGLSINFIPETARAKKEKRVTVFTLLFCALALGLTMALAAATVSMHWKVLNRLNRRVEILQEQARQIEAQEAKAKDLQAKLSELAKDNNPRLTPLLKELAELLPLQTYLLSFDYQNGEVKLQGLTQTSASELVSLLENSPWLRQVPLGPTSKLPQGDMFSLQAQVEK
jgi:Tfp pilus assembly protein PilN